MLCLLNIHISTAIQGMTLEMGIRSFSNRHCGFFWPKFSKGKKSPCNLFDDWDYSISWGLLVILCTGRAQTSMLHSMFGIPLRLHGISTQYSCQHSKPGNDGGGRNDVKDGNDDRFIPIVVVPTPLGARGNGQHPLLFLHSGDPRRAAHVGRPAKGTPVHRR